MKKQITPDNLVRYSYDFDNPPPLTKAQVAEIETLRNKPDEDIDFSDIPRFSMIAVFRPSWAARMAQT
jgi:hypothetical protein